MPEAIILTILFNLVHLQLEMEFSNISFDHKILIMSLEKCNHDDDVQTRIMRSWLHARQNHKVILPT